MNTDALTKALSIIKCAMRIMQDELEKLHKEESIPEQDTVEIDGFGLYRIRNGEVAIIYAKNNAHHIKYQETFPFAGTTIDDERRLTWQKNGFYDFPGHGPNERDIVEKIRSFE